MNAAPPIKPPTGPCQPCPVGVICPAECLPVAKPVPVDGDVMLALIVLVLGIIAVAALRSKP